MTEPDVFISSSFIGFMDVRAKIQALDNKRIWAPEPRPSATQPPASPFQLIDDLVAQVRRSNLFICVLQTRYGSSVFRNIESVSFLEAEIYEAAIFHNNVRFFLMEPFEPDARLRGLLDLVRTIRPGIIPDKPQSERLVLDQIKRALDQLPSSRRSWAISLRKLISGLAAQRGHPNRDIEFFDKVFRPISTKPDRDHIRMLLDGLAHEQSTERRLTHTWLALRELSAAPYDASESAEYLPLWNDALGAWSSSAAWYGLHGHLYAGRLAAVNSLLSIRERMDARNIPVRQDRAQYIQGTKGARASEYYSMAKVLRSPQREYYLHLAERDLEDALRVIQDEPSGYIDIRGHIRLLQGRPEEALADFEEVRRLRDGAGDRKGAAEAAADLGLAHLRLGNRRLALRLLKDGTATLESAGSHTFAIRARKRLALAELRSGHPVLAVRELCTAYEAAVQHQVYDQITPLMETAHTIASAIGLWRPLVRTHAGDRRGHLRDR
jgi:tetratricopeptide (TPR) repeat protein